MEPSEEETEEEEQTTIITPTVRELLVLNRVLHTMESPNEGSQRELIFDSRCVIQGKVFSSIIDGRSCNVASVHQIDKHKLPTAAHHVILITMAQEMK